MRSHHEGRQPEPIAYLSGLRDTKYQDLDTKLGYLPKKLFRKKWPWPVTRHVGCLIWHKPNKTRKRPSQSACCEPQCKFVVTAVASWFSVDLTTLSSLSALYRHDHFSLRRLKLFPLFSKFRDSSTNMIPTMQAIFFRSCSIHA